jgi:hypothetical protein
MSLGCQDTHQRYWGVPEEAAEECHALKEESGVECMLMDKVMEGSAKIPALATGKAGITRINPAQRPLL